MATPLPHILIVDDTRRGGWVWGAVLRRAGFQVSIAADTGLGWQDLDGRDFAMLITSEDALGRRSLELIAKLRRRSRRTPCILVRDTASDEPAAVLRLLRPGVVLQREVTIPKMLAAVRSLIAASTDPDFAPVSSWGFAPYRGARR